MEEDESDDDIVVVCCSVLEGVEYLEQSQAKLGAVEEIINVLKIVHEGVENIGVSMCKKEPLTDGSAMLNTGELEITFTLRERQLEFDPVFTGVDGEGKTTATKKKKNMC